MAIEHERRFLVDPQKWNSFLSDFPDGVRPLSYDIIQGYISDNSMSTVRIRIIDDTKAFLTVKGIKSKGKGLEFEYAISVSDAYSMLNMCEYVLHKIRYYVNTIRPIQTCHSGVDTHDKWEVDVFHDENTGLIIAEIEFDSDDDTIHFYPSWIREEITENVRYANSQLAKKPFLTWM